MGGVKRGGRDERRREGRGSRGVEREKDGGKRR